jgi:hypothetical protein
MLSFFSDWRAYLAEAERIATIVALLAGAVAAFVYVPLPRLKLMLVAACLVGAAAIGAYDAGYRARGRLDATADLRQAIEQRDLLLARRQEEASDAAKIADEMRIKAEGAEERAAEMKEIAARFVAEQEAKPNVQSASRPSIIFRRAPTPACDDRGLGSAFERSLQSIDKAATRRKRAP